MRDLPTGHHGYSLLELLFVVTIILIIAAIAVPRFLKTKYSANEVSAANSLRQINTANANYSAHFNIGYAGSLAQLGPATAGCTGGESACADLLDSVLSGTALSLAQPVKSGYRFTYYAPSGTPTTAAPNGTYAVVATPTIPGNTGVSTFCIDNRGAVYRDTSGTQTTAAPGGCAASWPVGPSIGPI